MSNAMPPKFLARPTLKRHNCFSIGELGDFKTGRQTREPISGSLALAGDLPGRTSTTTGYPIWPSATTAARSHSYTTARRRPTVGCVWNWLGMVRRATVTRSERGSKLKPRQANRFASSTVAAAICRRASDACSSGSAQLIEQKASRFTGPLDACKLSAT